MDVLRTPEDRFDGIADFPYEPRYVELDVLRVHYVDEGPARQGTVLMMHGEPTWSYLYRHMIPIFVDAGFRAVAPDLVGFGRSDKPARASDYSYQRHVDWMSAWLHTVDLSDITLVCQDWGALIGLRLAVEHADRFSRIVVANGFLPTGDHAVPLAFKLWRAAAWLTPVFPVGLILRLGCARPLSSAAVAAYNAPFPDESYKQGARAFPQLVPTRPDDPSSSANRAAWDLLRRWERPFLTAFSDKDPIMRGGDRVFQKLVPGAQGQPHVTIENAGHFVQEDAGPELARVVVDFVNRMSPKQ